jgi:uncharacterized protein YjiS (DUF1127 family)
METHSRRSLFEIHGINAPQERRLRRPPIAPLAIAQILTVLRTIIRAIEAKLRARRAIIELANLDDRMLRDLGITRSEIESAVRGSREATDEGMSSHLQRLPWQTSAGSSSKADEKHLPRGAF